MAFFAGSSISMQPRHTLGTARVCGLKLGSFMIKGRSSLSFTICPRPAGLQICCAASDRITDRIRRIVSEQLGVNIEEVVTQASFVDDLGADSLETVELKLALEEEFDIEIDEQKAKNITTVQDVVDYIENAMT